MTKTRNLADLGGGFIQEGTGAVQRTVESKLQDVVSVKDFGAVGDGVTDDMPYFQAMASALGYIVVTKGLFALNVAASTAKIDVPIFFSEGGGITVPAGQSVTFRNRIEASPKQQIFYGDGLIYFVNDNGLGIGEDSKHSYAAWWGIFAVGQTNTIQTALFNKALAAYTAQVREGIFELDCGSYQIDGTVTIPRGVWFKGASTRRTIIDLVGSGYPALQSGGSAVWITGIQFEQLAGDEAYFDGIQFNMLHDTFKIEDVLVWNAKIGINVGGDANIGSIEDVRAIYGREPAGGYPSDSATIVVAGNRCTISNVLVGNTTFTPAAVIRIDASTATTAGTSIDNVVLSEDCICIDIQASGATVAETAINNITKSAASGFLPLIRMNTSSVGEIRNISLSNLASAQATSYVLDATQGSSGKIEALSVSGVTANFTNTKLAKLTRTAGTFVNVAFGGSIAVGSEDPIEVIGAVTKLQIPNYLLPTLTIANDSTASFKPNSLGGLLLVKNNGNNGVFPNITSSGAILFDVGSSPSISKTYGGANFATFPANTVPTGTTGTTPNLTVSATSSGTIYLENRTGGSIEVNLAIL